MVFALLPSFLLKPESRESIKGISFVAPPRPIESQKLQPLLETGAGWVAYSPFAYMPEANEPEIVLDMQHQWWGEKKEGARECIRMMKRKGLKIMLKPQLWVNRGTYTGEVKMQSEEDWQKLEDNYRRFIMEFALLAREENVEIFCIGTELRDFAMARPQFWKSLIGEIRLFYNGKITYAGNWDSYTKVSFWKDLDYIGVDAYFPLLQQKTPAVDSLLEAWEPIKRKLRKFAATNDRKVLFTEYGYRSRDYNTHKPWASGRNAAVNMPAQTNALKAIHQSFWDKKWFAGGFLWKWHANHAAVGGANDTRFTIQNKPAERYYRDFTAGY